MAIAMPCIEAMPGEMLTERHVQALWYDRAFRSHLMYTQDGTEVRVIDPGEWNLENGPDFKGAVLEIGRERKRLKGDVEVHLRPMDWEAHHHGRDRAYDGVVAHVTWTDAPPPPSLPKGAISIPIGKFVSGKDGFSPEQVDLSAYPFGRLPAEERPCRKALAGNPDFARSVLRAAGLKRLFAKAGKFERMIAHSTRSRKQIFYEEFMASLGYRKNTSAFKTIAEMVPYEMIEREPEVAEFAFFSAASFVDWDKRNIRPNNRPEVRLSAAGKFFMAGGLEYFTQVDNFSQKECREMIKLLRKDASIGKGRAAAILANVIVPMAVAERRIVSPPAWLPPEDFSSPMRLTAMRLFGRDHNPNALYLDNGLHMQGLLQIYREYCLELYPECTGCEIAKRSAK